MSKENRVEQAVLVDTIIRVDGCTTRIRVTTDPDGDGSFEIVLDGLFPNLDGLCVVKPSDNGIYDWLWELIT